MWAEVSLSALRQNFRTIQEYVTPGTTICAVVKADGYGHGAVECARTLEAEGATWFGVTSTEEGLALRQAGIQGRIMLMTGFWRGEEEDIISNHLTPAIWDWWQVGALEAAVQKLGCGPVAVHVKFDTGMARLGVPPYYVDLFLKRLKAARAALGVEGVFTHLASTEVLDAPDVERQMSFFEELVCKVQRAGFTPTYLHVANSAAVLSRPHLWKNMVRPGLALYGYHLRLTTRDGSRRPEFNLKLQPVLSWKTRVIGMRYVEAGAPVGYGGTYVTERPTMIAILPVGYADGLARQLSSPRGRVIVRDSYAPILGRVSMDLTLCDVTDIPGVNLGDEVIIMGSSERCSIDAWEHAHAASSIAYEVLCGIGKRVPRKYIE